MFIFNIYLLIFMRKSLPTCMYMIQNMSMLGAYGIQKMGSHSHELELWATMWVLGPDPEPSANTASALNHWVTFSVQQSLFYYKAHFNKVRRLKLIFL